VWVSSRGQHESRDKLASVAHFRHHAKSVLTRQHDVQNQNIKRRRVDYQPMQRFFSRLKNFNLISFRFQVETQAIGEVLLVFYDENSLHFEIGS
jgi:hypothetical protein